MSFPPGHPLYIAGLGEIQVAARNTTLWMAGTLVGAREAVRIADQIYVSPAMAYLLITADDAEQWAEIWCSIPVREIEPHTPEAWQLTGLDSYGRPAKKIPWGPLTKSGSSGTF